MAAAKAQVPWDADHFGEGKFNMAEYVGGIPLIPCSNLRSSASSEQAEGVAAREPSTMGTGSKFAG